MTSSKRVRIESLSETLKIENIDVEVFEISVEMSIGEVYSFQKLHPEILISAMVLRSLKRDLIAPPVSEMAVELTRLDLENAREVIRETHLEAAELRMDFLSEARHHEMIEALLKSVALPDASLIELRSSGVRLGILMYRPLEYLGESTDLVSWIWREPTLDFLQQQAFRHQVHNIITTQPHPVVLATVHLANHRSMRFFAQLGLRPLCLAKNY